MKNINSILKILINPGSIFVLSLIVVLGAVVYRGRSDNRQSKKIALTQSMHSKMKNVHSSTIKFHDVTSESGIDFSHIQRGQMLSAISEVVGSGACTADVDNDGFLDIYAVNGSGYTHYYGKKWWWYQDPHNTLYLNNGNGTFIDVTEKAGVGDRGWGMGCAFADYDNDGNSDLYVTNYGSNVLYRNNGDGTFTDITEKAGVGNKGWGTSVAWGDYNKDGKPDIYVANYLEFDKTMNPGEPNNAFKINMPLLMNSGLFDSQGNVIYRNNGNGTFTDVTAEAGLGNPPGKSMGAVFFDYNNDGFVDIYVANDKSRNVLYRNNRDGTFIDAGGDLMVDSPLSGMGVAIGDYDNDGDMDIFSTYTQSDTNILYQNDLKSVSIREPDKNKGFSDITVDSGLGEDVSVAYFGWGAGFVDFDNDGYLDLFVANSHPMVDFDNPQATIGQKNQVFRNNKDATFSDISSAAGSGLVSADPTRGAVFGDFDNDGDMDIFLTNNNDYARFLKNETENNNHWINIKLQGTKSGEAAAERAAAQSANENVSPKTQSYKFEMQSTRDALGARVTVVSGDIEQHREVRSGSGYLSQSDTRLHFGLDRYGKGKADLIKIKWPSGRTQIFKDVSVNRFVTIVEGDETLNRAKGPEPNRAIALVSMKKFSAIKNTKITLNQLKDKRGIGEREGETLRQAQGDNIIVQGVGVQDDGAGVQYDRKVEAVKALGILKDKRGTEILIDLLKNKNHKIRKEAVTALGVIGDKRAINPLLVCLNNEQESGVFLEIIKALKNFESDKIILPLIHALENGASPWSMHTENSHEKKELSRKGAKPQRLMHSKNSLEIKLEAAKSLSALLEREQTILSPTMLKKRLAVVPMIKALKDKDRKIREHAVKGLGFSESYRAVIPITKMFDDQELEVRKSAVRAAGLLKDKRAIAPLLNVLRNNNEDALVRVQTVLSLHRLKSDLILKPLFDILDSQNGNDERYKAVFAITALIQDEESFFINKKEITGYLQKGIKDPDFRVRKEVIKLAVLLRAQGHSGIIMTGLNDSNIDVRREAAEVTNRWGNKDLLASLKKRLNDQDAVIKKEALLSLGSLTSEKDKALLKKIVSDRKETDEIRMAALRSLIKTDSLAAIKIIEAFLKTDDPETKRECLKILGLTNNKRAIKPLMANLETSGGKILFKEAVLSLSKFLKEKQVFYALMKKMKDKNIDKETRLIILSTLSNSQQGKVFPYLINIINDRDDDLKLDAIKAIAEARETGNAGALLKKVFDTIAKLI